MTTSRTPALITLPALLCLLLTGCTTPSYTTSPYHPGPDAGRAVGTGVGLIVGETAGTVVGVGEGVVQGVAAPFDTTTRIVRKWHTETTADGRTIQVYGDILVDSQGRPVTRVPPPRTAPPATPPAVPSAPTPSTTTP